MKSLYVPTIVIVLLVGCGKSQQPTPPETQTPETVTIALTPPTTQPAEAEPAKPVAEVQAKQSPLPAIVEPAKPLPDEATIPEPSTGKAPNISIAQAAETGNIEVIKQHLAAGANLNKMVSSLHRAAYGGHKEIIELLITNGIDVNAKNDAAETPLHLATDKEIVELLIANGADVNATTNRGTTPLDWAANDEIANLIREHGGKSGK